MKAASRQIDRGNRRPLVMDTIGKNSQEGPALKVQVAKSPACLFHLLEHAENLASTRLASFNRTNARKRQPISLPSKTKQRQGQQCQQSCVTWAMSQVQSIQSTAKRVAGIRRQEGRQKVSIPGCHVLCSAICTRTFCSALRRCLPTRITCRCSSSFPKICQN